MGYRGDNARPGDYGLVAVLVGAGQGGASGSPGIGHNSLYAPHAGRVDAQWLELVAIQERST